MKNPHPYKSTIVSVVSIPCAPVDEAWRDAEEAIPALGLIQDAMNAKKWTKSPHHDHSDWCYKLQPFSLWLRSIDKAQFADELDRRLQASNNAMMAWVKANYSPRHRDAAFNAIGQITGILSSALALTKGQQETQAQSNEMTVRQIDPKERIRKNILEINTPAWRMDHWRKKLAQAGYAPDALTHLKSPIDVAWFISDNVATAGEIKDLDAAVCAFVVKRKARLVHDDATKSGDIQKQQNTPVAADAIIEMARLRKMMEFSPPTFNKYRKLAGLAGPKCGGRGFTFSITDARNILQQVITNSTSVQDKERARKVLKELEPK